MSGAGVVGVVPLPEQPLVPGASYVSPELRKKLPPKPTTTVSPTKGRGRVQKRKPRKPKTIPIDG